MGLIFNAKDLPLNQKSGLIPDVSNALKNWFQQMTFTLVNKSVSGFQAYETAVSQTFRGVFQPFSPKRLEIKPIGERNWSWFTVHSDTTLELNTDDCIEYLGKQYRVMEVFDFKLYGYFEYHMIEDFTGSGPYEGDSGDTLNAENDFSLTSEEGLSILLN